MKWRILSDKVVCVVLAFALASLPLQAQTATRHAGSSSSNVNNSSADDNTANIVFGAIAGTLLGLPLLALLVAGGIVLSIKIGEWWNELKKNSPNEKVLEEKGDAAREAFKTKLSDVLEKSGYELEGRESYSTSAENFMESSGINEAFQSRDLHAAVSSFSQAATQLSSKLIEARVKQIAVKYELNNAELKDYFTSMVTPETFESLDYTSVLGELGGFDRVTGEIAARTGVVPSAVAQTLFETARAQEEYTPFTEKSSAMTYLSKVADFAVENMGSNPTLRSDALRYKGADLQMQADKEGLTGEARKEFIKNRLRDKGFSVTEIDKEVNREPRGRRRAGDAGERRGTSTDSGIDPILGQEGIGGGSLPDPSKQPETTGNGPVDGGSKTEPGTTKLTVTALTQTEKDELSRLQELREEGELKGQEERLNELEKQQEAWEQQERELADR